MNKHQRGLIWPGVNSKHKHVKNHDSGEGIDNSFFMARFQFLLQWSQYGLLAWWQLEIWTHTLGSDLLPGSFRVSCELLATEWWLIFSALPCFVCKTSVCVLCDKNQLTVYTTTSTHCQSGLLLRTARPWGNKINHSVRTSLLVSLVLHLYRYIMPDGISLCI